MVINGEYPNVFSCGNCGEKQELDYFDINRNTMVCKKCHGKVPDNEIITDSTVYALQFIVVTPVDKLFSFTVTDIVLKQLKHIIGSYMDKVIDKKFNSLEFL